MQELLYTFYGDDFTGSTDVLEQLALGGVCAALFLAPPSAAEIAAMPGLQAVGVAGDSRSRTPQWMRQKLPEVFGRLRKLGAPLLHYKVCSTFDSSPEQGSIGCAIEAGLAATGSRWAPVIVGAPHLRRYVHHGMLFASDADGVVQRIDRHPMSRHPVTPMREPRLSLHLAQQTRLPIREATPAELLCLSSPANVVVVDSIDDMDLQQVGIAVWSAATKSPLFAVGSSGLTTALISAWKARDLLSETSPLESWEQPAPRGPLLVVSGSCAVRTGQQISWAAANGFVAISLDPQRLIEHTEYRRARLADIVTALNDARSVVAYTAMGASSAQTTGDALGQVLGGMLHEALTQTSVRRVLLCGGDTSSHAVQQLGLCALVWRSSLQPGVPLCRAIADGRLDGLELALKGGQVGSVDFFGLVRDA